MKKIVQALPQEALSLFVSFSRFEYALKRAHFARREQEGGTRLGQIADELGPPFFGEVRNSGIARDPIAKTPKSQIVIDGELSWKDAEPVGDVRTLFVAIRRVRNNLFHGGKFPQPIGPLAKVSRDRKLLAQPLAVLQFALEKSTDLKDLFWGGLQVERAD